MEEKQDESQIIEHSINQEQKNPNKFDQKQLETLKSFKKITHEMSQNKEITIQNPNIQMTRAMIGIWQNRRDVSLKHRLVVKIQKATEGLQFYEQQFKIVPSLKIIVNGQPIENTKGQHIVKDNKVIQGTSEFRMVVNQEDGSRYIGGIKDGQYHKWGTLYYQPYNPKYSSIYQGEFQNGKRHGKGTQKTNKTFYIGLWADDYKNGKGIQTQFGRRKRFIDGKPIVVLVQKLVYQGLFKDGDKSGFGTQRSVEKGNQGQIYQGNWKLGLKNGKGSMKYSDKSQYQGEWGEGVFQGQGVLHEANGNVYEGSFHEGKFHGQGVMKYLNGDTYEGQWVNGKKHGTGMYTWIDGDYYDGEWFKDQAKGKGVSMVQGIFYQGQFHLGLKNGLGQETDLEGNVLKAIWQKGIIIKKISYNGEVFDEQQDNQTKNIQDRQTNQAYQKIQ